MYSAPKLTVASGLLAAAIAPAVAVAPYHCYIYTHECTSLDCGGAGAVICDEYVEEGNPGYFRYDYLVPTPASCFTFTNTQTFACNEDAPEGWTTLSICTNGEVCCIAELSEIEPAPDGDDVAMPHQEMPCIQPGGQG